MSFPQATSVALGRFWISGLLGGRWGSEVGIGSHAFGERFVLLDIARLFAFDPPKNAMGRSFQFRASLRSGVAHSVDAIVPVGRCIATAFTCAIATGPVSGWRYAASWVRRSRPGFGWTDNIDAPLASDPMRYHVKLRSCGQPPVRL